MKQMTSEELHETLHKALAEVDRKLASGELDQSGRFYTDEKLRAGAATGRLTNKPGKKPQEPARITPL
jgi:ribosomal protein L29